MADTALTDGERWSRELLFDLRAENYRPDAWLDFLGRSFERAGATRRARPALARQARRWGIVGAGATFLAASRGGPRRLTALAWWALCWAMLEWHLGMVEGPGGERRLRLSAADGLTLTRVALVPFVAAPAGRASWAGVVAVGGVSDAADGWLARRSGPTRLGRELDSSVDAAFFSAAALGPARAGWIARPVVLAVLARHLGGVGFVAWHWLTHGSPPELSDRVTRWAAAPSTAGLLLASSGAGRAGGRVLGLTTGAAAAAHAAGLARTPRGSAWSRAS